MGDNNDGILLEDIDHKLKTILEGQAAMGSVPVDIAMLKNDMKEVKDGLKTIQAAVLHQTRDLHTQTDQFKNHEIRLTTLEQTA